jgi:hemolysin-activating ACP:hemolysin acyltransferase
MPKFRLFRPRQPVIALGLAVNYLMSKPAFANLRFGDWTSILIGQINRGHYYFAVDADGRVRGFIGWALAGQEEAEAWLQGRPLPYERSMSGDCIVFNAWAAESGEVHRFLVDEARKVISDKKTVYFKRHYKDGTTRPARLTVNDFVNRHIRKREAATPAAAPVAAAAPQAMAACPGSGS